MAQAVSLPEELLKDVKQHALLHHRSVPKQIEHWLKIGKMAEQNPDLPYEFIESVLESKQQASEGKLADYEFG